MLPIIGGQQNTGSNIPWPSNAPPPLPFLGYYGISPPQPQTLPVFNQENIPFPLSAFWNRGWPIPPPFPPIQSQCVVGRPILGRRNEPNHEKENQPGIVDFVNRQDQDYESRGTGDVDRGVKRCRPPSPLENWSQNNNQVARKSASPYSNILNRVNTSLPPPPIVDLPRKDSESTYNPVELHVTNLDMDIELKDLKKLIMSAFREHVMVLHVSVFAQSDGSLAASVKLPSLQDAQFAISQLHRRKVGHKRIMIAYAQSHTVPNQQYIKNLVVSLLLEVPGHKMPLFGFLELFARRYLATVSVSELYHMEDACVITGEKSGRMIHLKPDYRIVPSPAMSNESNMELPFCVRHSQQLTGCGNKGWAEQEQPNLANVRVSLSELSERVTGLVNSHNNWLPLASLMDCYAAEYEPLTTDERGAPLEHLVTCINGLELVHTGTNKHLRAGPNKQLLDTRTDESIVLGVSPSLVNQVSQFARELVDLLKMQPHCQLLFNRFIPAYHHHFGRQCRVADYGFTKLIDLLEKLPHVVQVMGEGNKRAVTLSHRAQMRRFTSDLLRVLKSQTSKQVMASDLGPLFERALGRPFDPVDYGLCTLEDLLGQLVPNVVQVSGRGSQLSIAIPKREQTQEEMERTKHFSYQVIEILSLAPQCSMEFAKFIPAYHHHYGTQCRVADFGFNKLIELFEAIPDVVKIEEEGEGVRKITLTLLEKMKVLETQISDLITARSPPGLVLEGVQSAYLWQFGYALKPSIYGCNTLTELLNKLVSVEIKKGADGILYVTRKVTKKNRNLRLQVIRVLWEQIQGTASLLDFEHKFRRYYNVSCGQHTLETELNDIVEVSQGIVELKPLQLFGREVYYILLETEGRLPLGNFESAYFHVHGVPLSPAKYGCASTLALLQKLDLVVSVCGTGTKRLIILNNELAAAGISLPPGLLKNGNQFEKDLSKHPAAGISLPPSLLKNKNQLEKDLSKQPAAGISLQHGLLKNGNQFEKDLSKHPDSFGYRFTSQSLLRNVHLKMSGNKGKQEKDWNPIGNGRPKHSVVEDNSEVTSSDNFDQFTIVNLPEPRTPPSKEECMALLSPAKFLLPANAFPFLASPPDPSELPRPGNFNLTQPKWNENNNETQEYDSEEDNKRNFRIAAHFRTPMNMK